MEIQIQKLIEDIKADYAGWGSDPESEIRKQMIADFNENIRFVEGRKYTKILTNGSVWGFVVNAENDKKFRKGDILKAAGYNAPARNAARGNILDGGYSISWTGPHYLR